MSVTSVLASEAPADCHLGSGCGFPAPDASIFFFDPYATFTLLGVEFALDKVFALVVLGVIILLTFWLAASRKMKVIPGKLQSVGEMGYLFVRDQIAREVIGKDGDRFVPLLVSLFFFVWMMNIWGIIPMAQFPVTSHFAYPVVLAVLVWVIYMFLGMKHQGAVGFYKNMMFPPGLPSWIYPLLAPIELLSNVVIRPVTLSLRLFANMFAGHLLLTVFTVGAFYLLPIGGGATGAETVIGSIGAVGSFLLTTILTGFEMLIQALQAFIFTLLAAVYIGSSLHAEH